MHQYTDEEISAFEEEKALQRIAASYGYASVKEYEDDVEMYQSAHVPEEGDPTTDEENYLSNEEDSEDMTTPMAEYGYPPILNNHRRISGQYVQPPLRSKDEEAHLNQIASQYGY